MVKRIKTVRTVKTVQTVKTVKTVTVRQDAITVRLPDVPAVPEDLRGKLYTINRLLTDGDDNPKLAKSNRSGAAYRTWGLTLAPAKMSGYQVCSSASRGCAASCLAHQGHARIFPSVNLARVAKTVAAYHHRDAFHALLHAELAAAVRLCRRNGVTPAVRLNVLSDLCWEYLDQSLFTEHPGVQFYDYTKHAPRMARWCEGKLPTNYYLTFSRSERNDADCLRVLRAGGNVAVVFAEKTLPKTWNGYPVLNGDATDMRFTDPSGHVVGLYAKGTAVQDTTGFVVPSRGIMSLPTVN